LLATQPIRVYVFIEYRGAAMMSFLVAVRNFIVLLVLAWLGYEAVQEDTSEEREDAARAAISVLSH